jgi:hypothetical protein
MKKFFVYFFISLFISNNTKRKLCWKEVVAFYKAGYIAGSITKERLWWDVKHII